MVRLKNWVNKINNFFDKKVSLGLTLIYMIIVGFVCLVAYLLIPSLFNYPPGSINSRFDIEVSYVSYATQFLSIYFVIILTGFVLLKISLSDIDKWHSIQNTSSEETLHNVVRIRKKCMNAPYIIYLVQICIAMISIIVILFITGSHSIVMIYKVLILVFSCSTLIALVSLIFTKKIFTNVLLHTQDPTHQVGMRIGLSKQVFMQMLPIIITSILFTSLIGYSRIVYEKSELMYNHYNTLLMESFDPSRVYDKNEVIGKLEELKLLSENNDNRFIIAPDKSIIEIDKTEISDFFIKYALELAENYGNRVYEGYAIDIQGSMLRVKCEDGDYVACIRYNITSDETIKYFFNSFLILLLLISLVLTYITKTLSSDISRITENLMNISVGDMSELNKILPITSNDEIGDLAKAFNKIQEREKDNIKSIQENQAILIEQERLASLGQLIGGIAHNLKTPIMSISGGIEALKDLAYEYRDSIGDRSVNEQDHKEIAKEMLTWLDKMRPYCAYMSDVISAVKGQAVQMISTNTVKFTVDEVVKRVELLLKHELKKYHCVLNVKSHVDASTELKGEVNNLVQVFDNIIINAMQAYDGENGTIDLEIVRSGDNVEFTIKDYGKGIPKNVADRLFKEMITTKGKNGTGLGLYMSYATIRGRFGGNMSFVSKEGCGTTFFISIPCIVYGNQEEDK